MLGRRYVPMNPEDQGIVDIARELCQRLGITRIHPQTVSWREKRGLVRVPPDLVFFAMDNIMLPKSLMGKLEPEEWKPLLASSLIYHWKSQSKVALGMIVRTIPIVLLLPVGLVFLDRILSNQFRLFRIILLAVYLPLSLIAVVYSQILSLRNMKRVRLDCDRRAAELAGPENLLRALKKIESLDIEKPRRLAHLVRPSIQQRINHLQSLGPAWTA